MELKKVGILSLAKITTVFGAIAGVLLSLLSLVLRKLIGNIPAETLTTYPALQTIADFTLKSALLVILQYTIFGFVWGAVIALIYNIVVKYTGGIKLDFKDEKKK